ncbi:glycosyltransferase family 2 protein [Noviherbaspirillum cavernae]|uniref:Glycosyltransferase family 2 protein n=1 Tax=Noviherbaspirillum cavernae TaxID=2320862 RepID=A0A418X2M3_9BURK|nr:glycosyltransferase family A protein [Noviherbaspirillum cavernae]RJG06709.1 glycosyltransferase family 2 protein [Noviherbaspirillum cavernae]
MSKVLAFKRSRKRSAICQEGATLESSAVEAGWRINAQPTAARTSRWQSASEDVQVSVVVPTCGRPELLNRCVASLVLQTFDPERFEIIVVDDRPSPDTEAVVRRWAQHASPDGLRVTYIPSSGPHGPAAARNRGWHAARGEIIAFTDDDTVASPDWIEHGLRAFKNDVHAVRGRITMPLNGTPTDYERDARNLETAEFVTANCFCRKRVLKDLGGFDERFRFAWREDSDLYFRLLDYRARIVHAPNAVITHPIRPADWGVSLSQTKKMQFDALLFKKHPVRYREKIRAAPRWDYYLIVAALLVCVAALAMARHDIAAVAGAVWLCMTARFCFLRLRHTSRSPAHVAEMIVTSALIPPAAVFWRAVGALRFRAGFL